MKSPAYNLQPLLEAVGGDSKILSQIITVFIDSTQSDMSILQGALAKNDSKTVKSTAHHLKGSLLEFGVEDLVAIALRLEQIGSDQELAAAYSLCADLEAGLRKLVALLDQTEYRRPTWRDC